MLLGVVGEHMPHVVKVLPTRGTGNTYRNTARNQPAMGTGLTWNSWFSKMREPL